MGRKNRVDNDDDGPEPSSAPAWSGVGIIVAILAIITFAIQAFAK
jgi:hypothetical protein